MKVNSLHALSIAFSNIEMQEYREPIYDLFVKISLSEGLLLLDQHDFALYRASPCKKLSQRNYGVFLNLYQHIKLPSKVH
jgi:hypothetical protein